MQNAVNHKRLLAVVCVAALSAFAAGSIASISYGAAEKALQETLAYEIEILPAANLEKSMLQLGANSRAVLRQEPGAINTVENLLRHMQGLLVQEARLTDSPNRKASAQRLMSQLDLLEWSLRDCIGLLQKGRLAEAADTFRLSAGPALHDMMGVAVHIHQGALHQQALAARSAQAAAARALRLHVGLTALALCCSLALLYLAEKLWGEGKPKGVHRDSSGASARMQSAAGAE